MRPYALVQIEDGLESDSRVVGASETSIIVIDWDMVETDGTAQELIDEIEAQYLPGEHPSDREQEVLDRLMAIVNDDDEEDYDDEEEEEDDFDDEDDDLDIEDELDEEDDLEEETEDLGDPVTRAI